MVKVFFKLFFLNLYSICNRDKKKVKKFINCIHVKCKKKDYSERWITWLVGRWRTQLIARLLVNCRTHEHRHFERTLRSSDILFPDHSWLRVVSISKTARFCSELFFLVKEISLNWKIVACWMFNAICYYL